MDDSANSPNVQARSLEILQIYDVRVKSTVRLALLHLFTIDNSRMSVKQWVTPLEGLDSLQQTETSMPAPGSDEVLVEVHAVSLNYRDVEGICLLLRTSM